MTFKEKLQRDHPERVNSAYVGGCAGCPSSYGYAEPRVGCKAIINSQRKDNDTCSACWDTEIKPRGVIYIAGPIAGVPNYWEAFEKVEDDLTARGWAVLSPAKHPKGLSRDQYMRMDFAMIDSADVVFFLPNWRNSPGACLEKHYCEYTQKPHTDELDRLEEVKDA